MKVLHISLEIFHTAFSMQQWSTFCINCCMFYVFKIQRRLRPYKWIKVAGLVFCSAPTTTFPETVFSQKIAADQNLQQAVDAEHMKSSLRGQGFPNRNKARLPPAFPLFFLAVSVCGSDSWIVCFQRCVWLVGLCSGAAEISFEGSSPAGWPVCVAAATCADFLGAN